MAHISSTPSLSGKGPSSDHVYSHPLSWSWINVYDSSQQGMLDKCLEFFCDSSKYAPQRPKSSNPNSAEQVASLWLCGVPILKLLAHLSGLITDRIGDYSLVIQRLDDLIALATEKFYAYPFKEVPTCWTELFREASLMKFAALALKGDWGTSSLRSQNRPNLLPLSDGVLDQMVRTMDMALIMAGPPTSDLAQDAIKTALDLLQKLYVDVAKRENTLPGFKRRKLNTDRESELDRFPSTTSFIPPVSNPISKMNHPSFATFETHILRPSNQDLGPEPRIITGALENWPARGERPWSNPGYLLSKTMGGRRLVPIETGRSYVDDGWGQQIITFKEFMSQYILQDSTFSGSTTGYLAQHDLFAQIPSLRQDIAIPDYCYSSAPPPHHSSPLATKHSQIPKLEDILLNAWLGPAGTISPLHTDPYHNILAQVVGKKYVRLYAPRESAKLYARGVEHGGVDMENTSAADVGVLAGWDDTEGNQKDAHRKFPLFKSAEYVDCILEEGECLYIPVGWWHYVRSLSTSFSVSFWFN